MIKAIDGAEKNDQISLTLSMYQNQKMQQPKKQGTHPCIASNANINAPYF